MRCRLHGVVGGRPRGTPEHPNSRKARIEGRRRWVERQRLAKAQGLIDKIPGGRKPGVRGRVLPSNLKAMRMAAKVEKGIEMALKALPAIPDRPKAEMSDGDLFSRKLRLALQHDLEVLERPIDWNDLEMLRLKTTIALSAQVQAVKLRVAELAPRSDDSVVSRLMERVAKLRRGETVIELESGGKDG